MPSPITPPVPVIVDANGRSLGGGLHRALIGNGNAPLVGKSIGGSLPRSVATNPAALAYGRSVSGGLSRSVGTLTDPSVGYIYGSSLFGGLSVMMNREFVAQDAIVYRSAGTATQSGSAAGSADCGYALGACSQGGSAAGMVTYA